VKLKYFIPIVVLLLAAFSTRADVVPASLDDKQLLCHEIKNLYDDPESELTINMETCLKNRSIRLYSAGAGQTLVSGQISFYRKGTRGLRTFMNCKITYIGKPTSGSNSDVVCGF
jgi:hypothetical protein